MLTELRHTWGTSPYTGRLREERWWEDPPQKHAVLLPIASAFIENYAASKGEDKPLIIKIIVISHTALIAGNMVGNRDKIR